MNMNAMLKQAQTLQKKMMKEKDEIDAMTFESTSSFVHVEMNGKKELTKVKIDMESLDKEDIEMLEDLIQVAVNDTIKKIDKETESKMGKYTKGLPF